VSLKSTTLDRKSVLISHAFGCAKFKLLPLLAATGVECTTLVKRLSARGSRPADARQLALEWRTGSRPTIWSANPPAPGTALCT
jgi:hypothetical protein